MGKTSVPVFAVSGSNDFIRFRSLNRLVEQHQKNGWKIDRINGTLSSTLRTSLSQGSMDFMVDSPILIVVDQAEKADLPLLESHAKDLGSDIVVLLHYEGDPKDNTKFGKFLKDLGKQHRNYPSPKDWDADKEAVEFVISEFVSRGKTIAPNLAASFVARLGSDLGFLYWEILKISMLADADDLSEIDAIRIKGGIAPLTELAIQPIIEAVARRNAKALAIHLGRLKKTTKDDQTIRLCRVLFDGATKWLAAAEYKNRGFSEDDAAKDMGLNPWFWKNKVLPLAVSWTCKDAARLVEKLGNAERAVLAGEINPWAKLVAGLMEVCRAVCEGGR